MFETDRLRAALEAVIRALGPNPVYLAMWPAIVVSWDDGAQVADVQLSAVGQLPTGLRNVPIIVDPPGTQVKLAPGTAVLVGFRSGDPGQPYCRPATAFGAGSFVPDEVRLADGGVTSPVARVGDSAGPWLITTGSAKVKSG